MNIDERTKLIWIILDDLKKLAEEDTQNRVKIEQIIFELEQLL